MGRTYNSPWRLLTLGVAYVDNKKTDRTTSNATAVAAPINEVSIRDGSSMRMFRDNPLFFLGFVDRTTAAATAAADC